MAAKPVEERRLAQASDAMFERNLSILAAKGKEIEVGTYTGEVHVGFLAGLDQQFLQLCTVEDQTLVLINRDYIVKLEETGETLEGLEREGYDGARRIRDRVRTFQTVAGHHSEKR